MSEDEANDFFKCDHCGDWKKGLSVFNGYYLCKECLDEFKKMPATFKNPLWVKE